MESQPAQSQPAQSQPSQSQPAQSQPAPSDLADTGSAPREFYKLSGAGNDFIALVSAGAEHRSDARKEIDVLSALCRRGLSVGADGVLLLERRPGGARLGHRNADGSHSALCLNGSRCAARLAFELGWTQDQDDPAQLDLETGAGILRCRDLGANAARSSDRIATSLPPALDAGTPQPISLRIDTPERGVEILEGWSLSVGVPHLVVRWDTLDALPIDQLGPALRHHPDLGPAGANVDFVCVGSGTDGAEHLEIRSEKLGPEKLGARHFAGRLAMRTWERGVEGETLACGTGAVATVRCAAAAGWLETRGDQSPEEQVVVVTTASGFDLEVGRARDAADRLVTTLAGDARVVARGTWLDGALVAPRRPDWAP